MGSSGSVLVQFQRLPVARLVSVTGDIHTLLGYTASQLLEPSTNLLDRVHPEDQDVVAQLFSAQTPPEFVNLRMRHADGRIRCLRVDLPWRLPTDDQSVLSLTLTDARRLYQPSPNLEAPDFVAMMENTDDFIFFKDRNHVLTGASQTLVRVTDPSEHWTDLLGKTDYDVFAETYADSYYRLEKQVFAGVAIAHDIQAYVNKSGQPGWVDNRKYPTHDAQGRIVGLFGVARDITELRRAEQARADSERRFKEIFEQLPSISVQGYNSQRQVIYWNHASEVLYGYSREQALGKRLEDLIIPPPMRDAVVDLVTAWSKGGPAIPSSELILQGADGLPVDVFSSHVMVNGAGGDPEMYCIDIDTSERNRAARALRASESFLRTIIESILFCGDHVKIRGRISLPVNQESGGEKRIDVPLQTGDSPLTIV